METRSINNALRRDQRSRAERLTVDLKIHAAHREMTSGMS